VRCSLGLDDRFALDSRTRRDHGLGTGTPALSELKRMLGTPSGVGVVGVVFLAAGCGLIRRNVFRVTHSRTILLILGTLRPGLIIGTHMVTSCFPFATIVAIVRQASWVVWNVRSYY
jgi:hypothetical protein